MKESGLIRSATNAMAVLAILKAHILLGVLLIFSQRSTYDGGVFFLNPHMTTLLKKEHQNH